MLVKIRDVRKGDVLGCGATVTEVKGPQVICGYFTTRMWMVAFTSTREG